MRERNSGWVDVIIGSNNAIDMGAGTTLYTKIFVGKSTMRKSVELLLRPILELFYGDDGTSNNTCDLTKEVALDLAKIIDMYTTDAYLQTFLKKTDNGGYEYKETKIDLTVKQKYTDGTELTLVPFVNDSHELRFNLTITDGSKYTIKMDNCSMFPMRTFVALLYSFSFTAPILCQLNITYMHRMVSGRWPEDSLFGSSS